MFRRLELLIGDNIAKLAKSKVIIFGVGGVGGYTAEMLVRTGIGSLTIVDYDNVDISNKNRQIIAADSTIGQPKVNAWKNRLKDINENCNVEAVNCTNNIQIEDNTIPIKALFVTRPLSKAPRSNFSVFASNLTRSVHML